jgi:predicted alternative tryptophan synthase beta-subunit
MHCLFEPHRIKGEWYNFTPEMLDVTKETLDPIVRRRIKRSMFASPIASVRIWDETIVARPYISKRCRVRGKFIPYRESLPLHNRTSEEEALDRLIADAEAFATMVRQGEVS